MVEIQAEAMVGETIAHASIGRHDPNCDGIARLTLVMGSGRVWHVDASYGGWTGESRDEHPEFIIVAEADPVEVARG
jgi:hypothetical protein